MDEKIGHGSIERLLKWPLWKNILRFLRASGNEMNLLIQFVFDWIFEAQVKNSSKSDEVIVFLNLK